MTHSYAQATPECYSSGICKLPDEGGTTEMTIVPSSKTAKCRQWQADSEMLGTCLADARKLREERDQCQGDARKTDDKLTECEADRSELTATTAVLRERLDNGGFTWWRATIAVVSGGLAGVATVFALDPATAPIAPYVAVGAALGLVWTVFDVVTSR